MRDAQDVGMFSLSDKGQARQENQDNIFVDPSHGLFILADGAGGGQGGGTASRLTVDTMAATLNSLHCGISRFRLWKRKTPVPQLTEILCSAAQAANRVVVDQAAATPGLAGMGSTVVAGVIDAYRCICITAGDSRVYHFHEGQLEQISQDHNLARSLIDQGFFSEGDGSAAKYRNVLTRAVGMQDDIEVSSYDFPLEKSDIVLVCSDGLTNMVPDETIVTVLATPGSLGDKARELIRIANKSGGLDNISVILVRDNRPRTIYARLMNLRLNSQ